MSEEGGSPDDVGPLLTAQPAASLCRAGGSDPHLRVPDALAESRHFWRGVVDGDGSLKMSAPWFIPQVQLVGRPLLVHQFADHLAPIIGRRPTPHRHTQSAAVLMLSAGGRSAKAVVKHLYGHPTPDVLVRKAQRAAEIVAWQPQVVSRYPWDRWADGTAWSLERGLDYTEGRRVWEAGRRFARGAGLRMLLRDDGDTLTIQFVARNSLRPSAASATPDKPETGGVSH